MGNVGSGIDKEENQKSLADGFRLNVSDLIVRRFGLWEGHGKGASLTRDACGRNVSSVCPGDGPGQAQA